MGVRKLLQLPPETQVAIVRAIYDLTADDGAWLRNVMAAMQPAVDRGLGLIGFEYDHGDLTRRRVFNVQALAAPDDMDDSAVSVVLNSPKDTTRAMYSRERSTGAGFRSQYARARDTEMSRVAGRFGIADVFHCGGVDEGIRGPSITSPLPDRYAMGPRTAARWRDLSWHMLGGWCIRQGLREQRAASRGDALVDIEGPVVDVNASNARALEALRAAAVQVDRQRSGKRVGSVEAERVWRAMLRERWALVDSFEANGRRYLVARRGPKHAPDPRGLTPREREIAHRLAAGHTQKLIAYELGLKPSTVATHVQNLRTKLSAPNRVALQRTLVEQGYGRRDHERNG
jgi:DNA-binding CsgD family transcriptional regulator